MFFSEFIHRNVYVTPTCSISSQMKDTFSSYSQNISRKKLEKLIMGISADGPITPLSTGIHCHAFHFDIVPSVVTTGITRAQTKFSESSITLLSVSTSVFPRLEKFLFSHNWCNFLDYLSTTKSLFWSFSREDRKLNCLKNYALKHWFIFANTFRNQQLPDNRNHYHCHVYQHKALEQRNAKKTILGIFMNSINKTEKEAWAWALMWYCNIHQKEYKPMCMLL